MFTHYRTQGFILEKNDSGEFDRIFTVYTKDFGKLDLLAKAERKIKSKLRAGLELFYLSEIEFIQGKAYKTLTDTILINNFKHLRQSLKRLSIAHRISNILDDLVKGQEPDQKIWQLLNETFERLDNLQFTIFNLQLAYYYFLWNFLSILGYQPELYSCPVCQEKLTPENIHFNPKEGGLICQNCSKSVKSGKETDSEIVKILRIILKKDWVMLSKIRIEKMHLKSLDIISKDWYSFISSNL